MKKNTILSIVCAILCTFLITQNLTAAFNNGDFMLTGYGSLFQPQSTHKRGFDTIVDSAVKFNENGGGIASARYFFLDYLALEASSGIVKYSIKGKKSINDLSIGETWFQNNALMLQYYFNPCAKCMFHVGSGAHFSLFFDSDSKIRRTKLDLTRRNWGLVSQAGLDYMMSESWFFQQMCAFLGLVAMYS